VLIAEPLDLIWPHTVPTALVKTVIVASVEEPKPELDICAIFIVNWKHVVEGI
jgi:hypothetical protein